jgi:anion-transporting  ArsA/GET3 family ATPase
MKSELRSLIMQKRVIVCCGAGGVGKTSVAAALAVAAARLGRRVLVVTIDPSRRLAETLHVMRNPPRPVPLPAECLAQAGISAPGSLEAWMLDPQVVSDSVVRRFSRNQEEAGSLLQNRIYRSVTSMVAGMQEYTAVEAIHGFITDECYDLIVLDTPPSRNALHFLEAPGRINRFLDGRLFRFFLPSDSSLIRRATSAVLNKVFDIAFGQESRQELMVFFGLFASVLQRVNVNAEEMRQFFSRPDVTFIVVTSPTQEALEEARYIEKRTREDLKLNLSGYILNRSLAHEDKRFPDDAFFSGSGLSTMACEQFRVLAEQERRTSEEHRAILASLEERLGHEACIFAEAMPYLSQGVADMDSLLTLIKAQGLA